MTRKDLRRGENLRELARLRSLERNAEQRKGRRQEPLRCATL